MVEYSFIVSPPLEDTRLLEFLATKLSLYSINTLKGLIEKGSARVNKKRTSTGTLLKDGDVITVSIPEDAKRHSPRPLPIEVLYEDEHTLVINKPAGLAVIPERGEGEATLLSGLLYYLHNLSPFSRGRGLRPRLIHRLDKDTSGVLLIAKDLKTERHLSKQFESRTIEKEYIAIVDGRVEREEATINLHLEETTRGKMRVSPCGKEAVTHYQVQERFKGFTLLRVLPKTGRMHQIRIHLKTIGHPLSVDPLYGNRSAIFLSSFKADYKPKEGHPETPIISRLPLHANKMTFEPSPSSGKLTIEAPIPKDMERLIKLIRKYKA